MTTATLTSSSQVVGTDGNTLSVLFKIANAMSAGGTIALTLPYWNPSSTTKIHHLTSPTCTGTFTLSGSLTCTYDSTTRILTVTNSAARSAGATLGFDVTGFRNPYNGIPKSGFSLATYDSSSCNIESISSLTV